MWLYVSSRKEGRNANLRHKHTLRLVDLRICQNTLWNGTYAIINGVKLSTTGILCYEFDIELSWETQRHISYCQHRVNYLLPSYVYSNNWCCSDKKKCIPEGVNTTSVDERFDFKTRNNLLWPFAWCNSYQEENESNSSTFCGVSSLREKHIGHVPSLSWNWNKNRSWLLQIFRCYEQKTLCRIVSLSKEWPIETGLMFGWAQGTEHTSETKI